MVCNGGVPMTGLGENFSGKGKKRMTLYLAPKMLEVIETLAKKTGERKSAVAEKAVVLGLPKLLEMYNIKI